MDRLLCRKALVLVCSAFLMITPGLHAQEIEFDFEAPEILHNPQIDALESGIPQIISATVTDNVGVKKVVLHYRTKGEQTYKQLDMLVMSDGSSYMGTIPERDAIEPGIEYFFEATDESGNTSSKGFGIMPLVLSLVKPQSFTPVADKDSEQEPSSSRHWLWIGLGAAILGGLALSAGGGGGADDEAGSAGEVPLTITVTPP